MKYKYLILLNFFISCETLAEDSLGRLFFTPDQRAQLDTARAQRGVRPPATTDGESAATPAPQGPDIVTYNGVVRRSDGKSTVWINGKPVNEKNRSGDSSEVRVLGMRSDGAVSLTIPQAARTASLKVGQSLDVMSGRIEEPYARQATRQRHPENAPAAIPARPPSAPQAATPGTTSSPARPVRPLPESYFKESDPDSGAAPAERASKK